MQTFKGNIYPLLLVLPIVCGMGHAQPQDAYTGEYSLNIPADAGFGNNFNLVTFPDHAPQTQQAQQYDVSLLQQQRLHEHQQQLQLQLQQQQQAQHKFKPQPQTFEAQPQRFQPRVQPQSQRFQPQPQKFQQRAQSSAQSQRFQPAQRFQQPTPPPQRFQQAVQPQRFEAVPQTQRFPQSTAQLHVFSEDPSQAPQQFHQGQSQNSQQREPQIKQQPQFREAARTSTDVGRFSESRRPSPQHGGFSNFPAREPVGAPTFAARPQPRPALPTLPSRRVQSSGDRRASVPAAFASQSSLPAAPVHQVTVESENAVADYDYDPGLSRYQLFKLRQKAKLAAEETERLKENRSLVKVVKKKRIQG